MFNFGKRSGQPSTPKADASAAAAAASAGDPQLLRLNRDFLALLLHSQRQGGDWTQLRLTDGQQQQLSQCDEAALQRMAACGFSLFCLSLHQPGHWQQLVQHAQSAASTVHSPPPALHIEAVRLLECALFYVWHIAQQHPQAGRLSLALAEDTARQIARLDIRQCQWLASQHPELLVPRWRHNPYFWNDLLRYGQTGAAQHFKFARVLGAQLIAQDLEPSAIARLSGMD